MNMRYKLAACGGTFDLLHSGHKAFLRFAFSVAERVYIGITSESFILKSNKKTEEVADFFERKGALEDFLTRESLILRARIISIDDIYGPTLDKKIPFDALIATENTIINAEKINSEREKAGLKPLPVVIAPLFKKNDLAISSSKMREGLMNSKGDLFVDPEVQTKTYILPGSIRKELHKPFGKVLKNGMEEVLKLNPEYIVAIGDITASRFNKENIKPKISVVDYVVERRKSFDSLKQLGFDGSEEIISVTNPSGMITSECWKSVLNLTKNLARFKRYIIKVTGEEDLLFIPLFLALPNGYHLFYGQPHEGLVHALITTEYKEKIRRLFDQFVTLTTRGY